MEQAREECNGYGKIKAGAYGELSLLVIVVERERSGDWTSTHEGETNRERLNTENVGTVRVWDWPECNEFTGWNGQI
jgi:hypothetical protein